MKRANQYRSTLESALIATVKLGLLYAWLAHGVDWAGNVFAFWVWLVFAFSLLLLLAYSALPNLPLRIARPYLAWLWRLLTWAQIVVLVGAGHAVLAWVMVLSWVLAHALAGTVDQKEKGAQA
ncbi:hypothetical protein EII18_02975 [Comamonadaceae bacterium OH3737_COT-264]|nr:hypothetical protein EII18_02975 [Comamonadaceae bacterium OH3737_COT-264]